jgi:hypothetical protein
MRLLSSVAVLCAVSLAGDLPPAKAQAAAAAPAGAALTIDHNAVRCLVAERYPILDARIGPAESIARARVLFRAAGGPSWYFVDMRPEGDAFRATLPSPLKTTTAVDYYIEAFDRSLRPVRTGEHVAQVVDGTGGCPRDMMSAAFVTSARIAVGALSGGASAVPLGFSGAGIASAAAGGAAAGAATAGGGGGGGISTGAVLGIAAGGAAVAAGTAFALTRGGEHWVGTATLSPADRHCTSNFALEMDLSIGDTDVTGKVGAMTVVSRTGNLNTGVCPEPEGSSVTNHDLRDGSVSGNSIRFSIFVSGGEENDTYTFSGTRTEGTIEGTITEESNSPGRIPRTGPWRATRQ